MSAKQAAFSGKGPQPRWPRLGLVVCLAVVAGLLLMWWRVRSGPRAKDRAQETATQPETPGLTPAVRGEAGGSASFAQGGRTVGAIMVELRKTYRPGGLPARIRLQGELSERWEKSPPSAAEVIDEIADTSAPPEHRIYIAHSFRNLAKMNRLEVKEAVNVLEQMLEVVADGKDDPLVRGQLAVVIVLFDKSPEVVRAAASLLDEPIDDASYLAVTALRHTASEDAATELFEYLQLGVTILDRRPRTTGAALLALTDFGGRETAPISKGLVAQTESADLLQKALLSLSKSQSTVAVVEALLAAFDRTKPVQGVGAEQIRSATLRALRQHAKFIQDRSEGAVQQSVPTIIRARTLL